jgi:hypothetical protein
VNSTACCENSNFCLIDTSFSAACCQLGSDCGNPCSTASYICPTTITVSGTPTISRACCPRACPVSQYKCAASLGGNCCPFGSNCQADGNCTATSTSSNPVTTSVPSGCTTNQFTCATAQGGGCCDNGSRCTVSDNTNYCAAGTSFATRTGPNGFLASSITPDPGNKRLSTGAKAGIGVGVSVGALLIIGALLYFFIIHRRKAAVESQATGSQPQMGHAAGSAGGGGSEPNGSRFGGSKRPTATREDSQPSDYFGPTPVRGPFTEDHNTSSTSPGYDRGVPAHPQSPGDIASPVEIDSGTHSNLASPTHNYSTHPPIVEHPVELP